MKYKYTSTAFRFAKNGYMYCVIYEKGHPEKELFRSSEGSRSDIVCEMHQYLNSHPGIINQVIA